MRSIIVLLLIFSIAVPLFAQEPQNLSGVEREALLELLYRHLHGAPPGIRTPEFFVGQLPPDLRVDVPLPNPSRLVGSIRRGDWTQVILDAPIGESEVQDFYRSALTSSGWEEKVSADGPRTTRSERGGFVPPPVSRGSVYCRSAQGPSIEIGARTGNAQMTAVYLSLRTDTGIGPCRLPNTRANEDLLPVLQLPEGTVWISSGGGGGGPGSRYTSITFESTLQLREFADFLFAQLQEEGWRLIEETAGRNTLLSTWYRENDGERQRQATLVISRLFSENRFLSFLGVHLRD